MQSRTSGTLKHSKFKSSTSAGYGFKTLPVIKQIPVKQGGLDGIMYDEPDDKIILTSHSRLIGTLTAIDPKTGDIVATVELEDNAPEGAAADGKGHIFIQRSCVATTRPFKTPVQSRSCKTVGGRRQPPTKPAH